MKYYIKDSFGNLMEVEDVQKAIFQIALYMAFLQEQAKNTNAPQLDEQQQYFKDLYIKLCRMREKIS